MQVGVVLRRGCAQLLSRARSCGLRAQAGRGPADHPLPLAGLEEESRLVRRLFGAGRRRRAPPGLSCSSCASCSSSAGFLQVLRVLGAGGLTALLRMPAPPVPHLLFIIKLLFLQEVGRRLPVRVAPLHAVITWMPRLAQGSPHAGLTVLRPARILERRMLMLRMLMMLMVVVVVMVRAVAPVPGAPGVSSGPAALPRRPEKGGGGVALGERGAHPLGCAGEQEEGKEEEKRRRGGKNSPTGAGVELQQP